MIILNTSHDKLTVTDYITPCNVINVIYNDGNLLIDIENIKFRKIIS